MSTSVVCLCFRSGSLRSGFPSKIVCAFLLLFMHASVRPIMYSLACYSNDIRSSWAVQITLCMVVKQQVLKLPFISSPMWIVREMSVGVSVFLTVYTANPQTVILEMALV